MSTQSRAKCVLDNPQASTGAQDLLKVGSPSKQGFIRRQGQLERIFKFLTLTAYTSSSPFGTLISKVDYRRQRFVVLSRGCIYIFKNEFSGNPIKAVSMKAFFKCQRLQDSNVRWAFQLLPEDTSTDKVISFACSDDDIRREWMKACRDEIMKAKNVSDKADISDRGEYVRLEMEVRSLSPKIPTKAMGTNDSGQSGYDQEEDYQTIDESRLIDLDIKSADKKPTSPATSTIGSKSAVTTNKTDGIGKPKAKLPTPPESPRATKGTPDQAGVSRQSFQYEGSDRDEIKKLLTDLPEGTYLVRKSRMDKREVLSVNIEGTLKEYKIYEKKSQYSLDNKDYFSSLEELLKNYTKNKLPNRTAVLYRAYSLTDPGYINLKA